MVVENIAKQLREPGLIQGRDAAPEFEAAPLPVHVVHHDGRRATQKVRAFVDPAVEALRADPALR